MSVIKRLRGCNPFAFQHAQVSPSLMTRALANRRVTGPPVATFPTTCGQARIVRSAPWEVATMPYPAHTGHAKTRKYLTFANSTLWRIDASLASCGSLPCYLRAVASSPVWPRGRWPPRQYHATATHLGFGSPLSATRCGPLLPLPALPCNCPRGPASHVWKPCVDGIWADRTLRMPPPAPLSRHTRMNTTAMMLYMWAWSHASKVSSGCSGTSLPKNLRRPWRAPPGLSKRRANAR